MSGWRGWGCCATTGTCYCKIGEAFLWQPATDRENTGWVMCLKHKGGVNHFATTRRHKGGHAVCIFLPSTGVLYQHFAVKLCWHLKGNLLQSRPWQRANSCSLEPWGEIQTSKPFLPDPLCLPYSCCSLRWERWKQMFKKGQKQRWPGMVPWLRVDSSVLTSASQRRGASALQFTFPAVRVCHLHSNVILVFLLYHWEKSSECVVCYRIKPPDCSFYEHYTVYSERAGGQGRVKPCGNKPSQCVFDPNMFVCISIAVSMCINT